MSSNPVMAIAVTPEALIITIVAIFLVGATFWLALHLKNLRFNKLFKDYQLLKQELANSIEESKRQAKIIQQERANLEKEILNFHHSRNEFKRQHGAMLDSIAKKNRV